MCMYNAWYSRGALYHMAERCKMVRLGWHCANAKNRKTMPFYAIMVRERSRDTKLKAWKIEGVPKVPLCPKYGVIQTIISWVTAFWKNWRAPFFFDRLPSWTCQSNWTSFLTYPSPELEKTDLGISIRFGHFFSSYHDNVTSCNLQPLRQGKVQRSQRAKNRTEPFPGKIGRGILNLVPLALTVT